jgi:hypothetical protein
MGATPLDGGIGWLSPFLVVDAVVENLPNQAAQLVGDGPDGLRTARLSRSRRGEFQRSGLADPYCYRSFLPI